MNLKTLCITTTAIALTLARPLAAQMMGEDDEFQGGKPEKAAQADAQYKKDLAKYASNTNFLVLPGLVADRKEKSVDVLCETTSLEARGSAEYLIVSKLSSHGYEAMMWSFASPSDLHKALEFVGVRAGAPADPGALRFWSKGERITASVILQGEPIPIERLILDETTEKTLPEEGWVFTGSMRFPNPTNASELVYLADQYDPRSIIAAYNEPASVLDPPWLASKGQFYESHVASPEFDAGPHELITVRFEPQVKDGKPRIRELRMEIKKDASFLLKDSKTGEEISEKPTFESALEACKKIIRGEQEPYITLMFDKELTLGQIRPICSVLIMLDAPQGLRIEPPAKGRIFYRAFLPNPNWQDPTDRMEQPWELHLVSKDVKLSGTMAIYDANWRQGQSRPDLTKRSYDVDSGAEILARLEKEIKERKDASRRMPPSVLLIYVPADVKYGTLLDFIGPAIESYNIVHLFLDEGQAEKVEESTLPTPEEPENAEKE